jgi:nicotinamidase-related amidase
MPLTQIDETAALVLIDLQQGLLAAPTVQPVSLIVERCARLAREFRARHLPVVLVNVAGRAPGRTEAAPTAAPALGWAELVPGLQQPGDLLVTKHRHGAFIGTALDALLRERGVTQLFIGGVATSIGVEATARSAYDHGYNVVLVIDAMTDRDVAAHRHSVEKIFPRLGETAAAAEVAALLSTSRGQ